MSPSARPPQPSPARPRSRGALVPAIALGVTLARRGPLAVMAIVVSVLTVIVLGGVAIVLARRDGGAPLSSMPELASSAIVWGGAFLQAVGVSAGALRRDRAEGVRQLFVTRTTSLRGYLLARVAGLAVLLALVAGGGTLIVSAVAILASTQAHALLVTLQATLGALLYAVVFAAVIAPVAFATLGNRTRLGGYFALLLILVVPELLVEVFGSRLSGEVAELCAIPSALAALRSSLAPGSVDLLRMLRALVALAVFSGLAALVVRRDAVLVAQGDGA
jgi:hypothetical protein